MSAFMRAVYAQSVRTDSKTLRYEKAARQNRKLEIWCGRRMLTLHLSVGKPSALQTKIKYKMIVLNLLIYLS